MPIDRRTYLENLLTTLQERMIVLETDKEKYEALVESWELKREEMEIHIECVVETIENLP